MRSPLGVIVFSLAVGRLADRGGRWVLVKLRERDVKVPIWADEAVDVLASIAGSATGAKLSGVAVLRGNTVRQMDGAEKKVK